MTDTKYGYAKCPHCGVEGTTSIKFIEEHFDNCIMNKSNSARSGSYNEVAIQTDLGTDAEYILCAAIYFDDGKERVHQPKNIDTGIVVCGQRHGNAFVILYEIAEPDYDKQKVIQGFLTSKNRFVDRVEAFKIAVKMKQTMKEYEEGKILFSEDLY